MHGFSSESPRADPGFARCGQRHDGERGAEADELETSDRWVGAVWPVDRWCRYQPVASSKRLCESVYAGHTWSINSDNFEANCYTDL